MPTDTFVRDSQRSPLYQHIIAPPTSRHREGPCSIPPLREPVAKSRHDKPRKGWNELTIKIKNIAPVDLKTLKIWEVFSREGNVCFIEIFEGRNGRRDGNARVRFSPAPMNPVWQNRRGRYAFPGTDCNYFVDIELVNNGKRGDKVQSLLKKGTYYDPVLQFNVRKIHFGIMVGKSSMMPLYAAQPIHSDISKSPILEVDLHRHRITASFDVGFYQQGGECNRINRYMLQIPFASLQKIQRMDIDGSQTFTLIISLASPPQFFLKRQDNQAGHSEEGLTWSDFDTWYRQTDIVYNPLDLVTKRVALHKNAPIIDIGRWTTYFFEFNKSSVSQFQYHNLEQALRDFNIVIENIEPLLQKPARPGIGDLWSVIDPPDPHHSYATNLGELQANDIRITLPFEVRYQLEVCISHGLLNEHNIDALFLRRLADMSSQDVAKARNLLEWVDKEHTRIYNPMSIFQNKDAMSASYTTRAPHYCAYSRKATVTPSTIYFNSPTVETTNRVLRHYARENSEGRFLRVQFTDERGAGRINACAEKARNDELFTRVYRTLHNGIQIGNRHYEFLAFGNSQFRENGAYFFCPTDHLSCNDIRQWMGNFSNIKVVAKYAARLGQCFSTTRAINSLSKPDLVRIADEVVKFETKSRTKEYNFTDGVGKISPFLAQMVAAELGIPSSTAPSAFQFRLGGCKGILVVWPEAKEREVHIRESQEKFPAIYNGLEIIRCAKFSVATLNRQTITILSSLGVPNKVFIDLLVDQLASYQSAMSDDELAVSLLLRYIDENGMTINIATMIRNGFMAKKDPFVLSLLHLWRSWSIKLLKEKAKIIVENGAFLLGCVDETNTLKGYKSSSIARGAQNLEEDLPEIFIQVPDKKDSNKYTVVKGICLVGRNPSLHPGDLRLVRAVDIKALHHLRDVVVFPRNGDRDIPSMCSGGDLDGDDYFVIWDKALLPREWNCDPMNYDAPKTRNLRRPVEIVDLMKFFVRFMKNDSLSAIAHAHLALSDYLEDGVKDERCLELAALHSKAVDYVKTGEPAQMPKRLRPPKWPHFMEKKFKPKEAQYHSTKILGQLYDKVETINFVPQYEEPFDQRILEAYVLDEDLLKSVRQVKRQYDTAVRRLMTQQDINTEFEIWSTFVLSKPRVGSDYKLQEEIGRLSEAIKKQFRGVCEEKAGGKAFDVLGPFVAGMYKVTKEELDIALAECRTTRVVEGREVPKRKMEPRFMPLISFPWLFEKELGRIATGVEGYGNPQNYGLTSLTPQELNQSRKQQDRMGATDLEDSIQPEYGITGHHAEELDLFRQDDSDDYFNSGGSDDTHYMGNDYDFIIGDKEEATSYSGFQPEPDPAPGHSLDGDSDTDEGEVVPRI